MPIRKIKKVNKNLITYYGEIPNYENYLISNYGEVIKKSTWKKLTVINNTVTISIEGRRKVFTISKLVAQLFPTDLINFIPQINIVKERTYYAKGRNNSNNSNQYEEETTKKPKYVYKDNGRGGYVREKVEEVIEYDYQSLPDSVFYNGVPVDKKNLSVRAINKILAEYNKK